MKKSEISKNNEKYGPFPIANFRVCIRLIDVDLLTESCQITPSQTADKTTKSQEKKHKIPKILKI